MGKTVNVRVPSRRKPRPGMLVYAGHTLRLSSDGTRECARCGEVNDRLDHFRRTYCDARNGVTG